MFTIPRKILDILLGVFICWRAWVFSKSGEIPFSSMSLAKITLLLIEGYFGIFYLCEGIQQSDVTPLLMSTKDGIIYLADHTTISVVFWRTLESKRELVGAKSLDREICQIA